jgi:hypothetical protein
MNDLNSNTWYQLCIQCQRNTSFNSINEVQCLRKQTKRSWGNYNLAYNEFYSKIFSLDDIFNSHEYCNNHHDH